MVLDLDETLVSLVKEKEKKDGTVKLKIKGDNEKTTEMLFVFRPYLSKFLKWAHLHFELVIFTASIENYAQAIVDYLDPNKKLFAAVLSRQSCMETKNGLYIKDLRIIRNRKLSNIILIDNLVHSFAFQINNGFPILEFKGNQQDKELMHLADFLKEVSNAEDIPSFLKEHVGLAEESPETPKENKEQKKVKVSKKGLSIGLNNDATKSFGSINILF